MTQAEYEATCNNIARRTRVLMCTMALINMCSTLDESEEVLHTMVDMHPEYTMDLYDTWNDTCSQGTLRDAWLNV